jgi:hypothetical protein
MSEQRAQLQLIKGGDALQQVDLTDLLENMDVREAMPQLRALARRRKSAANSALAVVASTSQATAHTAPDRLGNRESD